MAVEAPVSKRRKTNLKIYILVCIILAVWLGYDGYFNEKFRQKHTVDGKADGTLFFNQKSPAVLIAAAVLLAGYLSAIRRRRIVAEEEELVFGVKDRVPYDSIKQIDKTNFKLKGFFIVTYVGSDGRSVDRKLSDGAYDNLGAVLEVLITKIS
ncbi:MAG TPA: hypothetical protein VMX13_03960 [Sedimentisphaerales bacterium]|nr:hypothetical protein [Sedimentisphaerales bacterium]